ncbi:MAG: hypothetical protein LBR98_07280 [Syntrophomonadaceae bacterium]|nr:hypothetical protein [Syntrophomonadaceae bacterium]
MSKLKIKVRFDYEGKSKRKKLINVNNSLEKAEELRQQKAAFMRNIPIQGIEILEIDMSQEAYTIRDEIEGQNVSYAPMFVTVMADSVDAVIKFPMDEAFRTIEIIEPELLSVSRTELERVFCRINTELLNYRQQLERKRDWK